MPACNAIHSFVCVFVCMYVHVCLCGCVRWYRCSLQQAFPFRVFVLFCMSMCAYTIHHTHIRMCLLLKFDRLLQCVSCFVPPPPPTASRTAYHFLLEAILASNQRSMWKRARVRPFSQFMFMYFQLPSLAEQR